MATEVKQKYRLVTRSDMDGLVCAVLLKEMDLISEIKFVHPKDVQDGHVALTGHDITTNLPYSENVYLSFDHHASELIRVKGVKANRIIDPEAPSAARVVYDHFGGKEKFQDISDEMMIAVDKADSAHYTMDDVLHPKGWELLSFIMDARTGLGRFKEFKVSNYELMMDLIDYCRNHTIEQILDLPDIKERIELYFNHEQSFQDQIKRCSTVFDNLVVLDLRNEEMIFPGNRFMIYALFPLCNISMHVLWGLRKQNTVFAVGKSIFNRSSNVEIGRLMLVHGGGGHAGAGTCQISNDQADIIRERLITQLQAK